MRGSDLKALPAIWVLYVSRPRRLRYSGCEDWLPNAYAVQVKVNVTYFLYITSIRENS